MNESARLWSAYVDLLTGSISRRTFLARAVALGIATPLALGLARRAEARQATPPAARTAAPDGGTENQTRGAGGELQILQWQAPTTLNAQLAGSFKDMLATALVSEPLLHYLPDGTPIPCLAKDVPSLDNGLLAADLRSVTYPLREGVLWSDGQPFTASDVVFTWQWIVDPANQSPNATTYAAISGVESLDDLTVKITFTDPQLGWDTYSAGSQSGGILPKHALTGSGAVDAFAAKPIGTGPFVVESFAVGDNVQYAVNPNYREPSKPFFATVNLKGGGDAASAARGVLQTGDWDFAWNLQVEPQILRDMAKDGKGDLVVVPGTAVEFIALNFSDPNKVVDGQRSQWQTPNPVLSDKAVRQAMALGVDRQAISENLYFGPPGEPPTSNILVGIAGATSTNTSWEFDTAKGAQLLEAAGWTMQGSSRAKNGVGLKLTYATTANDAVRQQVQAVVKRGWEEMGFEVQLLQIDPGAFFDTSPGDDQNIYHMYWDVHEYAWSPAGPFPLSYMLRWVSHNGENIPQKENDWARPNEERYNNPKYDALYDEAAKTTDLARADELFIQMNDIVIDDVVLIPIVQRASEKYALAKTLNHDNIAGGPFEALYWNIANWNRIG